MRGGEKRERETPFLKTTERWREQESLSFGICTSITILQFSILSSKLFFNLETKVIIVILMILKNTLRRVRDQLSHP